MTDPSSESGRPSDPVVVPLLRVASRIFDWLEAGWDAASMRRGLAATLLSAFVVFALLIELAREGILTSVLGHTLPTNHFVAISWTVTLLLIVEILDLVFGLANSVAKMIGKQLEIFSLVLLRKTFDALPEFSEPIEVRGRLEPLLEMAADAGGALAVFVLVAVYSRIQRHDPVSDDEQDVARFVATKKAICLFLLVAFGAIGVGAVVDFAGGEGASSKNFPDFFGAFYTILIFADVAIVLASLGATRGYRTVFRNFAFGFVTVFLRLALAAGPFWNAAIGVSAALFALATSAIYRYAAPVPADRAHDT